MDEIVRLLTSTLNTIIYYRDTDRVHVDAVELPAVMFAARAEVEWPEVIVTESLDDLIRYYAGGTHIGTQRPA